MLSAFSKVAFSLFFRLQRVLFLRVPHKCFCLSVLSQYGPMMTTHGHLPMPTVPLLVLVQPHSLWDASVYYVRKGFA